MRARRALLYMPGNDLHKIEKATTLGVDSICMDLEDSVAGDRKQEALETSVHALQTLDFGASEKLVRINRVDSNLAQDELDAILPARPDGIVVPKVVSATSLQFVNRLITVAEEEHHWPKGSIALIALIETPHAIINLPEISNATPRLQAFIFGADDMAVGLGAVRTPAAWEVFYARSAVVLHAAAHGLQVIDMVKVDFHDTEGLRAEALQGMQMGFTGKQIIHPSQVQPVQEIFTPSNESIAAAQRLLDEYQDSAKKGKGAFAMNGKMVDMPSVKAAQNLLAQARAAGK